MAFKFENLKVWKEAVHFASEVYTLTKKLPKTEQFGLVSQLNRAAVSVSLNIAEGSGRNSDADYSRFIQIAIGSVNEIVTLLSICLDQKYITKAEQEAFYAKCEVLSKMLFAFRNYLKS
jgi:four helix bundle protein